MSHTVLHPAIVIAAVVVLACPSATAVTTVSNAQANSNPQTTTVTQSAKPRAAQRGSETVRVLSGEARGQAKPATQDGHPEQGRAERR